MHITMQGAFRTLGRSGLVVSPLALGTMTFGNSRWGSVDEVSEAIFRAYVETGGNFIDTADVYVKGRSEELIGSYIADGQLRDRVVLATKFAFQGGQPLDVNSGGNGRKNMNRALEGSLRRLKTDYVDLYWMHVWDQVTPAEEVLQSMGDLIQAGKIRYFGFSDVPAWYAAKAATLAATHAVPGPIALQLEYSLAERNIEREHFPAARECGLGVCVWSPLAGGFLSGKYERAGEGVAGAGRLDTVTGGFKRVQKIADRQWQTLEALSTVAQEVERPMAQVALAWALARRGVSSVILGASTVEQLRNNLASTEVSLTAEQFKRLEDSSALDIVHPYMIFSEAVNRMIFGGEVVTAFGD